MAPTTFYATFVKFSVTAISWWDCRILDGLQAINRRWKWTHKAIILYYNLHSTTYGADAWTHIHPAVSCVCACIHKHSICSEMRKYIVCSVNPLIKISNTPIYNIPNTRIVIANFLKRFYNIFCYLFANFLCMHRKFVFKMHARIHVLAQRTHKI